MRALIASGLLLLACGGSDDPSNPGSEGGGGTGGAMTGGANTGGTGVGGDTSTGGSTGATGGVSGGTGGAGSVTVPPLPGVTCSPGQVQFDGTVGGAAVSETFSLAAWQAASGLGVGDGGFLSLDSQNFSEVPRSVSGALGFPGGSSNAGQIWCVDSGSLYNVDKQEFAMVGHLLGQCPGGSPVDGEVFLCRSPTDYCNGSEPSRTEFGGTLAGTPLTTAPGGLTLVGGRVRLENRGSYSLFIEAEAAPQTGSSVSISGFMIGNEASGEPGAVYCLDEGTWSQEQDSFATVDLLHVTSLSSPGNCRDAGATETLTGCWGY